MTRTIHLDRASYTIQQLSESLAIPYIDARDLFILATMGSLESTAVDRATIAEFLKTELGKDWQRRKLTSKLQRQDSQLSIGISKQLI